MKVLVLGGGDSPEKEVSMRSAKAVAVAARQAGFGVSEYDPANGFPFFDKVSKNTIVLPILHGMNGEDGIIQAELEERELPFLGTGSEASINCFDKLKNRNIFEKNDILMPLAERVNSGTYHKHPLSNKPHVLKILHGGSSIGTLIVRNPSIVEPKEVEAIFEMENDAMIEELIEGTEITVPILDKQALSVIEIIPPPDGEFDYDNKYNGASQELVPPKNVTINIQKKAQKIAEKCHRVMGCRHLSRTDFMVNDEGKIFALEINTMPGMTEQSLYPKAAAVAGITMPRLVQKFVEMVIRDYNL